MRRRPSISLALFLLIPVGLLLLASSSAVFILTYSGGLQSATRLSDSLRRQTAGLVSLRVDQVMNQAEDLVHANQDLLALGLIRPDDRQALSALFISQIRAHPELTYVSFGSAEGRYIGANRNPLSNEVLFADHAGPGQAIISRQLGPNDSPGAIVSRSTSFDPRLRPWYQSAAPLTSPHAYAWYPVYVYAAYARLGTGVSAPIRRADGSLVGVVTADMALDQLGKALKDIQIGSSGESAIVDEQGLLLAANFRDAPFELIEGQVKRVSLPEAGSPVMAAAWRSLMADHYRTPPAQGNFQLSLDGKDILVDWVRMDRPGSRLYLLTALPAADFFSEFEATTRQNLWLLLLVGLAAGGLMVLATRRILKPLSRLGEAARRYTAGQSFDFATSSRFTEIRSLSQALGQLSQSVQASQSRLESVMEERDTELLLVRNQASAGSFTAASIAHEVSSTMGNGLLANSRLMSITAQVRKSFEAKELTQHALAEFLSECDETALIIKSNLERSVQISRGFQTLMVDQLSSCHEVIDLSRHLEEILFSMKPLLRREGISLSLQSSPGASLSIDPGLLGHVVANLVNNAIKHAFSPPPAEGKKLLVGIQEEPGELRISVEDNGVGMDEATQARIFDTLFTTKRDAGGSGLGLAIIKRLVEQKASGSIRVESQPGKGSRFTVVFPKDACPG